MQAGRWPGFSSIPEREVHRPWGSYTTELVLPVRAVFRDEKGALVGAQNLPELYDVLPCGGRLYRLDHHHKWGNGMGPRREFYMAWYRPVQASKEEVDLGLE